MTRHSVHVECLYKPEMSLDNQLIIDEVERRLSLLFNSHIPLRNTSFLLFIEDDILKRVLDHVHICEPAKMSDIYYHYQLQEPENPKSKAIQGADGEIVEYFRTTVLPNAELDKIWPSLHFETEVNYQLLNYATAIMLASSGGVDLGVFDLHKILLLHGPPGCGKTSLCKALAQKISVRAPKLLKRPCSVRIAEVNCHSLFSKWFSESGKQIISMFDEIRNLASHPDSFVCLIIDEIESITISRTSLFKGSEPSDSIRAINVLLTQLDQIKQISNILILATSNLPETVDPAFLDRVDMKFKLGLPSRRAKFEILSAGLQELSRSGFIYDLKLKKHHEAVLESEGNVLLQLIDEYLSEKSGRSIRKLPFLALSRSLTNSELPISARVLISSLSEIVSNDNESYD